MDIKKINKATERRLKSIKFFHDRYEKAALKVDVQKLTALIRGTKLEPKIAAFIKGLKYNKKDDVEMYLFLRGIGKRYPGKTNLGVLSYAITTKLCGDYPTACYLHLDPDIMNVPVARNLVEKEIRKMLALIDLKIKNFNLSPQSNELLFYFA